MKSLVIVELRKDMNPGTQEGKEGGGRRRGRADGRLNGGQTIENIFTFIIYIYIRVKFGFWAIQPVFHIYDLGYMIKSPGIINHNLPGKNKYTNFKNIETILYNETPGFKIKRFINFALFLLIILRESFITYFSL